jgi:toxin YoeB
VEDRAWSEYLYWQTQDKKTLKRINALIKDIQRSPMRESVSRSRCGAT